MILHILYWFIFKCIHIHKFYMYIYMHIHFFYTHIYEIKELVSSWE